NAVVVAEHGVHHAADGDRVGAFFVADHHGRFHDSAYAQDRDLRLHDNGQAKQPTDAARVGDGKCSAGDVIRCKALGARSLAEVVHRALQPEKVQLFGSSYHRHNHSPVERHRDPEIDVAVVVNVAALD